LIDYNIIESENLMKCIKELLPPIKTCLSDDWAPDLRFATCSLCEKVLLHTKDLLTYEELHDLYPALLERLDDS